MASQITSLTIVYSTVYSGGDQRKHQSSASLALVREIHRWPRKMFPFDDIIMMLQFFDWKGLLSARPSILVVWQIDIFPSVLLKCPISYNVTSLQKLMAVTYIVIFRPCYNRPLLYKFLSNGAMLILDECFKTVSLSPAICMCIVGIYGTDKISQYSVSLYSNTISEKCQQSAAINPSMPPCIH